MDAKLKVVRGPLTGETFQVPPGKLLIGRETDCQLRLDSRSVSLHHCVLLLDEYTLRIRDLGSTNGTLVNGNRIGKHETILLHDDTVSVDNLTFQIDLSPASDRAAITDARPAVSSNALDATGIFDGDTDPVVPAEVVQSSSSQSQSPSQDELVTPQIAPNADVRMNLEYAAAVGSQERRATSNSAAVSSPHITRPKGSRQKVAEPAATLTNQPSPAAVNPKRIGKPKQNAARKNEGRSKTSRWAGLGRALPIAGLIAFLGLVAGGVFFLRGSGQSTPYEAPQKYVRFSPQGFEMMLICDVPEDWKQQFRGGKNIGPMWARFTGGQLTIEICENLTGGAIRETVAAMRKKADAARREAPPAEQIHEYQRQKSSESFKSYSEAPRSRGIKTKGYGDARISDFTATEGLFGTEVSGCRATALNQARQFTVTCKCPPSLFEDAKPVFEKVIASLSFEATAEAK